MAIDDAQLAGDDFTHLLLAGEALAGIIQPQVVAGRLLLAVGVVHEHVVEVGRIADAVVVGSALVNAIADAPRDERSATARAFMAELSGRGAAS